ncbi:uncharacterized protein SAPINGB_P002970 [Magnusiomyces paraingens]|uniref:Mitochondrial intermembrane space import and assembly protein 40 n=1 Tax=Magnusiomyces paraingens TaxID=2606893 RepID=A0A5E8BJ78_9ASCO|nr:uncharacterized protein SAPINGB_P002970 [Saprochaete ingens]VVT51059.1 unnamed protein product [Saprochaete ingens]
MFRATSSILRSTAARSVSRRCLSPSTIMAYSTRATSSASSASSTRLWLGATVALVGAGAVATQLTSSPVLLDSKPESSSSTEKPTVSEALLTAADTVTSSKDTLLSTAVDAAVDAADAVAAQAGIEDAVVAAVQGVDSAVQALSEDLAQELEELSEEYKKEAEELVAEAAGAAAGAEAAEPEEAAVPNKGAFDPDTGEINWDCPCLGGMAHGPCGEEFKTAFSCFVYSEAEPKGVDCIEKFSAMQNCFREHPEVYAEELRETEPFPEETAQAPVEEVEAVIVEALPVEPVALEIIEEVIPVEASSKSN